MPELADLLDLPAPHRFAGLLVSGVRGETLRQRPASHAGAVDPKLMAPVNLRGSEGVGCRRPGAQELA